MSCPYTHTCATYTPANTFSNYGHPEECSPGDPQSDPRCPALKEWSNGIDLDDTPHHPSSPNMGDLEGWDTPLPPGDEDIPF